MSETKEERKGKREKRKNSSRRARRGAEPQKGDKHHFIVGISRGVVFCPRN